MILFLHGFILLLFSSESSPLPYPDDCAEVKNGFTIIVLQQKFRMRVPKYTLLVQG